MSAASERRTSLVSRVDETPEGHRRQRGRAIQIRRLVLRPMLTPLLAIECGFCIYA
jgi:hypothetical protein